MITGPSTDRRADAISSSPGTSPSRPSTTKTTRSAVAMAFRPCSTTSAWRGSVWAPNIPPVSTREKWLPCHSAGWALVSRVVPASGATMAWRELVMLLNRVDFPTIGRPTSTTFGAAPGRFRGMSINSFRAKLDSVSYDIYAIYTSRGASKHDQGRHRQRGVAHCRHYQGQSRGSRRRSVRGDADLHATRRTDRVARLRGVPGQAPQAGNRP